MRFRFTAVGVLPLSRGSQRGSEHQQSKQIRPPLAPPTQEGNATRENKKGEPSGSPKTKT